MKNLREKQATEAYLKLIQSKGAPSRALYLRSKFLDELSKKLLGKEKNRAIYGQVLRKMQDHMSKDEEINNMNTAREFYPFWMNDIKAIAQFESQEGFEIEPVQWKASHTSLNEITKALETTTFDEQEDLSLANYEQAMLELGTKESVIKTRIKLAKIIVLRLRDVPVKNNKTYRTSAEITLPLFKLDNVKDLYLTTLREFFYFWQEHI